MSPSSISSVERDLDYPTISVASFRADAPKPAAPYLHMVSFLPDGKITM